MKKLPGILAVTGFTVIVAIIFLLPFIYGLVTSVKTQLQIANVDAPFIPSTQKLFTYDGKEYEVFLLKTDEGKKEVALIQKRREKSTLLDINAPNAQPFEWQGKWQTLEKVWVRNIKWQNYNTAYSSINFLRLLGNTVTYAVLSTLGAVCSAAMVSYGFARFKFPYRDAIFVVVMATIILPPAVTLIPRYAFFYKIGLERGCRSSFRRISRMDGTSSCCASSSWAFRARWMKPPRLTARDSLERSFP